MSRKLHITLLSLAWALTGCHNSRLRIEDIATTLPADGREHRIATVQAGSISSVRLSTASANTTRLDALAEDKAIVYLRTPVTPTGLTVNLLNTTTHRSFHIITLADNIPTADGTPDWMRLHATEDRRAFRRWFTELADRAADMPAKQLPAEITDCASFIRYAYREALRLHDDRWYAQFPAGLMPSLPSVQQWSYPNTPLGANLFRVHPGPFAPRDLSDGTFTQFADAKTLHTDNAFLLGRDLRTARPGDLIFYRVLETDSQYHSMIITGEHGEWVVYNTGPDHGQHGEMRRVLLADLLHHPDPKWRPQPGNPNWLGVYRWDILRED